MAFIHPIWRALPGSGIPSKIVSTKPRGGMKEHVELLREQGLPIPAANPDPRITVQNAKMGAVA